MNLNEYQCVMADFCLSKNKKALKVGMDLQWCRRCYQRMKIGHIEKKSNRRIQPDKLILSLIQTSSKQQELSDGLRLRILYAQTFSNDISVADSSVFLSMMTKQISPKATIQQRLSFLLAAYFSWAYGKIQKGERISERKILILIRLANNVANDLLLNLGWCKGVFARKLSEDGKEFEYRLLKKKKWKKWSKKAFQEIFEIIIPQFPPENNLIQQLLKQKW
ncbi:MAG: hypothetical protein ACFFDT_04720 [Candidatus Hodarchaeota archaeon]